MNTAKASEPKTGIPDWQKFISVILDYPIQTSLFIINFAFLLLIDPPVLLSILLLSALVYFIFAFGHRLSQVTDLPESYSDVAKGHFPAANPTAVENFEAHSTPITEPPKSPTRRVAQSASDPQRSQAKPQRTRRRATKS
ncbi:hypothetical protein [Methylocaldum sp.]|uniref:hypothetical protein n=1 Tax=Methylocaldum sp. TaxID=1969727 RepID=UPI002D23D28B|nr:hypothetical protein [Methylocaldum sp.]HYE34907.1 hypothetical protein [Methylocaldum sp.]